MEATTTKKSIVKQVLILAGGVALGLTLVKFAEIGIKKVMAMKK